MMSQGHHIYTPQQADLRYYHDVHPHPPIAHSVPAHEPAAAIAGTLHRRSRHALPSPPPPASSSISPYSSDPRCWSPGTAGAPMGPGNTLPPIMTLATMTQPPGPTPAPSPTALVHAYPGAKTHGSTVPDAQPKAKRHKSASPRADDLHRTSSSRRAISKRTTRSPVDTRHQLSADEAGTGAEAARILEERRRRNASASARFRKRRNERERELVARCLFLEHHLLQSIGPSAFDQLMRKAPAAAAIEGAVVGRRSAAASSVDMLALSQGADTADDDTADQNANQISVTALTAPKTLDDMWSAYLSLSQQVSTVAQRIQSLEDYNR